MPCVRIAAVALVLAACHTVEVVAQVPGTLDDKRLLTAPAETQSWIHTSRDYGNQRFVPLAQINRQNVAGLAPRWIYQTGVTASFQATPIVVDGVMYVSMPFNHVAAIDARTGEQVWRYEHVRKTQEMFGGPANRGVAVGYGLVYVATVDSRLVALDQKTGKIAWDVALGSIGQIKRETREALGAAGQLGNMTVAGTSGIGANMAPMLYKGMVFVGITGAGFGLHLDDPRQGQPQDTVVGIAGDYGRLGYMAAFDARTGREVWHFNMAPESGWEGEWRTQTADGVRLSRDIAAEKAAMAQYKDAWQTGGGSALTTPAIDPELGLLYFGTGSPSPQLEDRSRPGDNLYTSSLVALDVDTGKLRWFYQQVPHDLWGYEASSPAVLFDLPYQRRTVKAVGQAGKTGWFYVHDRLSGEFLFKSEAFIPQENMFVHPTAQGVRIAPGKWGGASWSPVSYDPGTGIVYVTALHAPLRYSVKSIAAEGNKPEIRYSTTEPSGDPNWGTLTALDLRNGGKIKWQEKLDTPQVGGVLATAGGLAFTGEGNGWFKAFDSDSGKLLWRFQAGAGVNAPPISYELDGTQYVVVAVGGNSLFRFKTGQSVMAFALPR
jgi:alcohol dehydrogenase (cytochrome c)